MSELETGTAEAASPAEAIAATPATEAPAENFDSTVDAELLAIYQKHNPPRGTDGKFAARSPVEPGAEDAPAAPEGEAVEGQAPEATAEETGQPSIPAPHSWSADMKAKWETLPPDAREFIAKRESEAHQTISRQGQQIASFRPIAETLEQNRAVFERNGVNFQDGINALLKAQVALETNPVAAIQQLAQAYGVDLTGLSGQSTDQGQGQPHIAALQAQIASLQRQLQDTSQRVMTREQREAEAQRHSLESVVNEFVKDKPDFASLEDDVMAIIPAIRARKPEASPRELLAEAYEQAQWVNPEARARRLDADRKAAEAKTAEEAKRKAVDAKRVASTNVRAGQPVSSKPKTADDALREIALRHYGTV